MHNVLLLSLFAWVWGGAGVRSNSVFIKWISKVLPFLSRVLKVVAFENQNVIIQIKRAFTMFVLSCSSLNDEVD